MVACDDTGDNTLNKGEAVGVEAKQGEEKEEDKSDSTDTAAQTTFEETEVLGEVSVNTSDEKSVPF